MKNMENRAVLLDCLKQFRMPAELLLGSWILMFIIFQLYGLQTEPFWYAFAVAFFGLASVFSVRLFREQRKAAQRRRTEAGILSGWNDLPVPGNLAEADYIRMIRLLGAEKERLSASFEDERREIRDFYTVWVHQIKTPIAVMKLALGRKEALDRDAMQEELFRIEQYTNMVLAFQRLGSGTNDLLIKEYELDDLIREVIREFAPLFIAKKLKLSFGETGCRIVTDKKWFQCILEQLISNALKYTPSGAITISVQDSILSVQDTGIGIAAEDLPRIFEKGYTGINGRLNDKSSGLGLYLCGKAAGLLNIEIQAESTPGKGCCFSLDLKGKIS